MQEVKLPEYSGIEDYIEKNKKQIEAVKNENKNKTLYHMRINLEDFGNYFCSCFLPTAGQWNTIRGVISMEPKDLDDAYNVLYSHLLVCPDKANFTSLYRVHGQIGLVNAMCNQLLRHGGFGNDVESKKDRPPLSA